MSDCGWALHKAIYDALASDPSLRALIGDPARLFDGPPERPIFPHVVFGDTRQTRVNGADELIEHDVRLHVHSAYDGRRETREIVTAIVSCLDDAPLPLAGFTLVSLRAIFTDVIHRQERDVFHGVVRLRAVTQEP